MAPKEPDGAGVSAKDIDSLFSRAGMIGAKYREFPRPEAVRPPAPSPIQAAAHPASAPLPSGGSRPAAATLTPLPHLSASRSWASLERFFADEPVETATPRAAGSGVKVALLSLAGGVGKTMLAVTLARTLSGLQRQVLLADCAPYPAIPHYFGARSQRVGMLQFLYPPPGVPGLPVGMFRLSLAELHQRGFHDLLEQLESSESLLLMDLPVPQSPSATEVLAYADHVLVPVTPDVHSIAGLAHLRQLLSASAAVGATPQVHYLLNRFDESRPLHHEIRGRLVELLGGSLLPVVVSEDPAIEEASANGMTVVDYRPDSAAAAGIAALSDWLLNHAGAGRVALRREQA